VIIPIVEKTLNKRQLKTDLMLIKEQDVLVKRLELKTPVTFTHEHAISKVIFSVRSTG